jgi:hypothetical protein
MVLSFSTGPICLNEDLIGIKLSFSTGPICLKERGIEEKERRRREIKDISIRDDTSKRPSESNKSNGQTKTKTNLASPFPFPSLALSYIYTYMIRC